MLYEELLKSPSNKLFGGIGILRIIYQKITKEMKIMPTLKIGRSILGPKGFCQKPSEMRGIFDDQLKKIKACLEKELDEDKGLIMTSMTGSEEIDLTKGYYFPKIRMYDEYLLSGMLDPVKIYKACVMGLDKFRPGADFVIWNSDISNVVCVTFSREAPILAFESSNGLKCLGTILRKSLLTYGDYLFQTIAKSFDEEITVTLVTCNHFEYDEGSIPDFIQSLAVKYNMDCVIGINSQDDPDCYHRGEDGCNHVVALW